MRKFIVNVNGKQYEVEVEEVASNTTSTTNPTPIVQNKPKIEQVSPQPKAEPKAEPKPQEEKKEVRVSEGAEVVTAPMPGTILNINVKEGETVKEGHLLIILEAMKMENEILAPRDGRVASVAVAKGASVNTGDQLVVLE
ncbi:MAG: biotin/lipoyl-binding protein [Tissierellia bacterium]|nr:biotin/lipoyl-binding protein [Tissierellia bacterium]